MEDAEPLAAPFREDPELGWLVGFPEDPTAESFREFWSGHAEARAKGEFYGLAIADPRSEEPQGIINLYALDAGHRRCELGIWLVPGARGRGAASEAMRLLCRWAFERLPLQRIALRTLPDNEPMLRLAERVGFRFEGILRHYTFERGRPVDNAVCSLLPGELA